LCRECNPYGADPRLWANLPIEQPPQSSVLTELSPRNVP
jgi:hypothetical protein